MLLEGLDEAEHALQAAFMTQFNFLDLVHYFLYRRNRRLAAERDGVTSYL